jgi:hypothetical protein
MAQIPPWISSTLVLDLDAIRRPEITTLGGISRAPEGGE